MARLSHLLPASGLRRAVITAVLLAAATPGMSQPGAPFAEAAQRLLDEKVAELNLVGVSAAISKDGVLAWEGGGGYRDRGRGLEAEAGMVHRIASITKAMTSTAVLQLVEAGEIDLDAPLQTYLPSYPESDKGVIRIHHLLTHTSSMRHYGGVENRPTEHYPTLGDAMRVFQDRALVATPGERFLYTTYGYTVLGAVIESVSGRSYGEHMREHVFGPAGMTQTRIERRDTPEPQRSALYRRDSEGQIIDDQETDLSVKIPGGGLVSTAGDLVRFGNAFIEGRLVSEETIARMLVEPQVKFRRRVPYGMGWMFWDDPELGRIIHQDGGQSGTSTQLRIYPDHGIVVALLGNVARTAGEISEIRGALVDLLLAHDG